MGRWVKTALDDAAGATISPDVDDSGAPAISLSCPVCSAPLRTCDALALFGFGQTCSAAALARGKYYNLHQGRNAYLRRLAPYHDLEMEPHPLRDLTAPC